MQHSLLRPSRHRVFYLVAGGSLIACIVFAGDAVAQGATGASSGSGGSAVQVSTGGTTPGASGVTDFGNGGIGAGGIGVGGTGVLPAAGFGSGSLSNIRDFVSTPLTQGETRSFEITPSIGIQAGYTDNVQGSSGGSQTGKKKGSFETRVTPGLGIDGESRRVQVHFLYNPTAYYYPSVQSESRIDQNLQGSALVEAAPQLAYLDLHALASQESNSNYAGPTSGLVQNRQDRTQIYSVSANPYLVHQFGDFGTGKIGYLLADTITQSASNASSTSLYGAGNTNRITQTEDAIFTTGDRFGRLNHTVDLSLTEYSGNATSNNGHRNEAVYDLAYAWTHAITFVAKVGYEDLYYSGTRSGGVVTSNPYSLKSPLGSAGVRLTPNEDSQLAVAYGYIDGGESLTLNAHYKPTARTVLYASSSSALTTDSQQIQDFANNSQIVPGGITIDPRTGAPVQYISTGSQATRNRLYRQTTTSLSAALLLDRDTLNASLIVQKQEDPPGAKVVQSVASNSVYGSLGWGHDVSESVSTSLNVRYGVQKSAVTGTSSGKSLPNFQASAGLRKIFSEKLVGTADYSYIRRDSNSSTQRTTVNEFLLGLQQRF